MPTTFKEKVLEVVRHIPKGKTMSYKQVARRAGSPGAYRVVGNIMARNWDPTVPCHRVIKSNGRTGQYNRGAQNKIRILKKEGAIK